MESAASKKLDGRMLTFLQKAQENETAHDYAITGVELGAARSLILAKIMAFNNTLKSLHLNRKGIQDKEG